MSNLDRILACAGRWQGINRLYESPQDPPDESASTLNVTPLLRGTFVRLDQTWAREGKPQEGSILIGSDEAAKQVALHWIDTFHMGRKVMICTGALRSDGMIDVRGGYAAPPGPDWGWRIEIAGDARSRLEIRMFNVEPAGTEALAVLATYAPAP
jgi:hypothetical protein